MIGGTVSRAGVMLIREAKEDGGAIIPIDRASRHSFGLSESMRDGEHTIRFNPLGTLRDDGRFTGGYTELG